MNPISSPKARAEFFSLMDTVNQSHEPALIIGKRSNAVLIAEGDWHAIEATLYLNAIPGMANSIRKGIQTDSTDCTDTPDWK